MLNPTRMLADALGQHLAEGYARAFGGREPRYIEILGESARLVIELIAGSDALYHDTEHTAFVTLVSQEILRGRRLGQDVSPDDWLHVVLAALTHDIGYVRGVCRNDRNGRYVIDEAGNTIEMPRGASDAFLAPYHVERSKIAVRERFGGHGLIIAERIAHAIELTRFPVPDDNDYKATDTEAALVRAADLVGQLGDPLYLRKLNALFWEFSEIGINKRLGYASAADLADKYPQFFWSKVAPYIGDAITYLERTMEGRQWVANLYSHVFAVEHNRRSVGPESQSYGGRADAADDRRAWPDRSTLAR
jgi:hypothetical protein